VSGLDHCPPLEELWLNMNHITDPELTLAHLRPLTSLKTVYLADNPVVPALTALAGSEGYHLWLKQQIPSLEQIDGYMLQQLFRMKQLSGATGGPATVSGITKKELNPKAKAIIQDVLMKNA